MEEIRCSDLCQKKTNECITIFLQENRKSFWITSRSREIENCFLSLSLLACIICYCEQKTCSSRVFAIQVTNRFARAKKNLVQIFSRKTIHCVISSWYPHVIPIHMIGIFSILIKICNQTNKEQRMFCNIYIVSYRWRNDNRM